MQACNRMTLYCVPLYDTLGENAIEYIVNHSESTAVFVATAKMATLVTAIPKCKGVKTVVYWGPGNQDAIKGIKDAGVAVYSFDGAPRRSPAVLRVALAWQPKPALRLWSPMQSS